jgi:hypothetical protein
VTAEPLADLRAALDGCADPVAFGVGLDGAVYAAARLSGDEPVREVGRGGASFLKSQLAKPAEWRVVRAGEGPERCMTVSGSSLVVSYVQPLPGERVLLVGARCQWRRKGPERNAVIVDREGRVAGSLTVGDGVEDVRVAPDGRIWVSYFDEGIFGNYGWSNPGPTPIGDPGLVAFGEDGEILFAYDAGAAGSDTMCDAYALNVTAEGAAWVYFYTQFPIVRIQDGRYRVWPTDVRGAHALAVRGDRALLVGDYDDRSIARVVSLGAKGATVVEKVRIECGESALPRSARVSGFGEDLVVFWDRRAYVVREW